MNNNEFVRAANGWSQITLCGEFPHAGAGVVQVIDRAARQQKSPAETDVSPRILRWWRVRVTIPRPADYDSDALPTELTRRAEKVAVLYEISPVVSNARCRIFQKGARAVTSRSRAFPRPAKTS